ncbi:MAG: DUF5606 domain-containing protein [Marinifilaceae bacterium]|jgi:hypothetical protein|nr:DUF5606 domain-containing protein [Marinifilaceae bacterium]
MLKGILAVSGKPGLYKMVANSKNALIVESLKDKKRMPAYASSKISALEDISIFTETGDMPLVEVFEKIYNYTEKGKAINHKSSPEDLKEFMANVLPEYDEYRVNVSDMKKLFQWYNILHESNILDFSKEEKTEE